MDDDAAQALNYANELMAQRELEAGMLRQDPAWTEFLDLLNSLKQEHEHGSRLTRNDKQ